MTFVGRTALFQSSAFLNHKTGAGHPESASRLKAIASRLPQFASRDRLDILDAPLVDRSLLELVHPREYIAQLEAACGAGPGCLDEGDTMVSTGSLEAALRAAGAAVEAVALVMQGSYANAFCAVRPPGHHAEESTAMGYCLFNNAAVAASAARNCAGADRIVILDWDVHHGNGTQHLFEEDPSVFYISLHQYPFYPGTGAENETGRGNGLGATKNFPLRAGTGDSAYLDIFRHAISDLVLRFRPNLIIVSAGFDAHYRDPLAGMRVTTEGFTEMSNIVCQLARETCEGRVVSLLEGGYDLTALAESVEAHVNALAAHA